MYEVHIGDQRLSVIAEQLRKIKAEATKVIDVEMKKVAGLVKTTVTVLTTNGAAQHAAQALQHLTNATKVAQVLSLTVPVEQREHNKFLYHALMVHPHWHAGVPEVRELAARLAQVETDPSNWV
jgi:hypothetical protein